MMVTLIDKLVKAGVLDSAHVAIWLFSKASSEEFMKFYMWEILHTIIKRSIRSVETAHKDVTAAKEKLSKVSALSKDFYDDWNSKD